MEIYVLAQGVSGIFAIGFTMIHDMFDKQKAGLYLGLVGTMVSITADAPIWSNFSGLRVFEMPGQAFCLYYLPNWYKTQFQNPQNRDF